MSTTVPSNSSDGIQTNCPIGTDKHVLLKMLPVVVGKGGEKVETYALPDDASTKTLTDQQFADSLNLSGPSQPLCLQWTNEDEVHRQNDSRTVITADRREYSRKPSGFPDMTVSPPARFNNYQPEYELNPEPEPFYRDYEPTQDSQWGTEPPTGWAPSHLKILTGPPPMFPPPVHMGSPSSSALRSPGNRRHSSPHKLRYREKNRDTKSRSKNQRGRDEERSHRRKRSRSRSRKHKSRSRSPNHRSHKKKKSRRHEDSE